MAPHGPPFDFDLNEPPPPENDGVNGISAGLVSEPSARNDPLLVVPVPEPSAQQDPLLAAPVPELKAEQDPLPPPAPVPEPTTAHVPLTPPAPVPEPTMAHVPLPARARSLSPVPEASPIGPPPATLRAPVPEPVPVPSPHHHLPSPVLDLEAPLSSLDDDEYEDEADLPLPPPPPLPLPPPPPPPPSWYRADTSPTVSPSRGQGDAARHYSSAETWAPRGYKAATASDTMSSQRSRRRPYSCDDAISKQRRVDYDEDGGSSSRSGSRRRRSGFDSPRRYERSGLAPPRHYYEQQDGGRRSPAAGGQPRAPPRNRRRRRAQQRPQYKGPVQKQQGRGWEQQQGFRGREKPQIHDGPHHGPEVPKVGYASNNPPPSESLWSGGRRSPEQEGGNSGWESWESRRQSREKDASSFKPLSSSRPHGKEDPYHGRQAFAQEPPNTGGGYQHRDREAPSFRPSPAGGRDGSYGGRHIPPEEETVTGGANHQQQAKAPRGRDEEFPDRGYHDPYARRRSSGFDRPLDDSGGGGRNPARRESRESYEQRRYSKQLRSGGSARGLRYYGDVQE